MTYFIFPFYSFARGKMLRKQLFSISVSGGCSPFIFQNLSICQAYIMISQFHELNTFCLHFIVLLEGKRENASEATSQHFRFRWFLPFHFSKSVNLSGIYYDQSISQIKYIFPSFYSFARGKEGRCFGSNYSAGRTNENRIDLNRNFPTWKQKGQTISELKQVSF